MVYNREKGNRQNRRRIFWMGEGLLMDNEGDKKKGSLGSAGRSLVAAQNITGE